MSFPSFLALWGNRRESLQEEMETLLKMHEEKHERGKTILKWMKKEHQGIQPRTRFNIWNPFHKEVSYSDQETVDTSMLKMSFYQWLIVEGLSLPDEEILKCTATIDEQIKRVEMGC